MYVAVIAGGIASGKSNFARELERLGARRIDLDALSREVLDSDADLVREIAQAFGADVVDARTGAIRRLLLAERAFGSAEGASRLEALELPAIMRSLEARLADARDCAGLRCAVVEVPLLDRVEDPHAFADEVVAVIAPAELRLGRAVGRGMDARDAQARMGNQPTDDWLAAHADLVVKNDGSAEELLEAARAWWRGHEAQGWASARRG